MPRRDSILVLVTLATAASILFVTSSAADHYERRFPQGYYESRFDFVADLVEVKEDNTLVVEDQTGAEWTFQLRRGTQAAFERRSLFSAKKRVDLASLEKGQQLRLRVQTAPRRLQSITVLTSETIPSIPGQGLGYQQGRRWATSTPGTPVRDQ